MSPAEQTILITGVGGGVGRGIATALAHRGAHVVIGAAGGVRQGT